MGMALVIQHVIITVGKEDKVDTMLAIEGAVVITYVAGATGQSASIIKVSGQKFTDTFT